jgi:hypothetical protein
MLASHKIRQENMTNETQNSDMEIVCSCKACRKTRIKQAKEFVEEYGEFRTRKELLSGMMSRDTLPIGILRQRAAEVIKARDLAAKQKMEEERLEKERKALAEFEENRRIEREQKEKEERLVNWREEKQQIIQENKELTRNSFQKIDELLFDLNVEEPTQLQEFGVVLQRSFTAINDQVIEIFNKSKVKDIQKTTAILFEKLKNFDSSNYEEYKIIASDFELLESEIAPLTIQSENIIAEYNKQYENIEKLVDNIDFFFKVSKKAIEKIDNEKQVLFHNDEISDLKKLSKIDDYNSQSIRLNKRMESLATTKMQAISFVSDLNGMKNIERSFVDDLSSIIYDIIPNWNNRMKAFFEMQGINITREGLYNDLSEEVKKPSTSKTLSEKLKENQITSLDAERKIILEKLFNSF